MLRRRRAAAATFFSDDGDDRLSIASRPSLVCVTPPHQFGRDKQGQAGAASGAEEGDGEQLRSGGLEREKSLLHVG